MKQEKYFDIEELKGQALNNAIIKMQNQLVDDNNEINTINDITLARILREIDTLNLKFNKHGEILINYESDFEKY